MLLKHTVTVVLCGILLLLCSCREQTGSLKGEVSYNKRPITEGEVVFLGKSGVPTSVSIEPSGNYEVRGLPYGDYMIAVVPRANTSLSDLRREWKAKGEEPPPELVTAAMKAASSAIPKRYHVHDTSGLTITISQPATPLDLPLVD